VADRVNDFELNMSIGGRWKLLETYSENLIDIPEAAEGIASASLELEFDPAENNIFYFATTQGLYKRDRRV